jgi:hypothetical protein
VSEPSSTWKDRWREGRFFSCSLLLVFAVAVCGSVILPFALWLEGPQGGVEASVAAFICTFCGLLVIGVTSLKVLRKKVLVSMLVAMAIRFMPPMVVCLVLTVSGDKAEFFSFICYLLLFYMISLAVETYLSMQRIDSVG